MHADPSSTTPRTSSLAVVSAFASRNGVLAALLLLTAGTAGAVVAGAGYTTFDANLGGCLDSPNGVNCNNYEDKDSVYINGGPTQGGWNLSDGDYYFSVLTPGSQNGGFVEGATGNLSDTSVGGTAGDVGGGDDISNRTFTVSNHEITYTGTHAIGNSEADGSGRTLIGLAPFDDTDNAGGVYILAICEVGATSPSSCKYDAFRIDNGDGDSLPIVSGMKYYDANTNGQLDAGEVGIGGWWIDIIDHIDQTIQTEADGTFEVVVTPDLYNVSEHAGGGTWMQTGNQVDQSSASGAASSVLLDDMSYDIVVDMNGEVSGLYFGNVCLGAGGGHTLGYWSNKNGQAVMAGGDNYASSLALLQSLNLVDASGAAFDPASYPAFRKWLLSATATNMAYMLSAQLSAMALNVWSGGVNGDALVYAPGTDSANAAGFATINDLMAEANAALSAAPLTVSASAMRDLQEALKDALDDANNNTNFVQPGPEFCSTPAF